VGQKLKRGSLVRWIVDYEYYAAPGDSGGVLPQEPIYNYGIVMEVGLSEKEGVHNIAVFCFADGTWQLLNMIHDNFELLSGE
jgi:hypothetical protein